jgi:hypothetical protein
VYKQEYLEILDTLDQIDIRIEDITAAGGNESKIPKKFSAIMRPRNRKDVKITGDLLVKLHARNSSTVEEVLIKDYIDGHNIDYVKGKVAVDMEWNSKDQTFDRDLYAFRAFVCHAIQSSLPDNLRRRSFVAHAVEFTIENPPAGIVILTSI